MLEQTQSLRGKNRSIIKTQRPTLAAPRSIDRFDEKRDPSEDNTERQRARGGVQGPSFQRRKSIGGEQQARECGRPHELRVFERHIAARKWQFPIRKKQRIERGNCE